MSNEINVLNVNPVEMWGDDVWVVAYCDAERLRDRMWSGIASDFGISRQALHNRLKKIKAARSETPCGLSNSASGDSAQSDLRIEFSTSVSSSAIPGEIGDVEETDKWQRKA